MTDIELARRWGVRVGHSLNVVAELPRYVDDPSLPVGLRVATVDAFFVHYRALIEFLIRRGDKRDVHSSDYVQGFDLTAIKPELHARLEADWHVASKQVAHLSIDKTASADAPIVEFVDAVRLRRHTSDLFEAMRAFVRYLADKQSPYTADFRGWVTEAESRRAS